MLSESWFSAFPCSGHLATVNEINPTTSHESSNAGVPSLQVEELRYSRSQQRISRHVGFQWQSHWAPKPSCFPAFTVWLGLQCLQAFRCLHMCQECNLQLFSFLVKIFLFYFWVSVLPWNSVCQRQNEVPDCPIPQNTVCWTRAIVSVSDAFTSVHLLQQASNLIQKCNGLKLDYWHL